MSDLTGSLQGARPVRAPGFGVPFAWDVPKLEGYRYKVMRNYRPGQLEGCYGCVNPGVVADLRVVDL